MNMKSFFILIPIFLFALLQGVFLPLNLVLLTVVSFTVLVENQGVFLIAFLAGLFLDLVKNTPLGSTSLYFLLLAGLLRLYAFKFNSRQPLFLAGTTFLGVLFWSKIFQGFWDWGQGLVLGLLSFAVGVILRIFWISPGKIKV